MKRFSAFLVACALATDAAAQDAPTLPVSIGGGFVSSGAGDTRYLKLDASNDPLTGALNLANGSAAAPSLTWNAGGVNTGFFTASAGLTAWSASGTQELTLSATDIRPAIAGGLSLGTSGAPWLDLHLQAGTLALPGLKLGDTNSGFVGGADVLQLSLNGVLNWQYNTTVSTTTVPLTPLVNDSVELGSASLGWSNVYAGSTITGTGTTKVLNITDVDGVRLSGPAGAVANFGSTTAADALMIEGQLDNTGTGGVVRSKLKFPGSNIAGGATTLNAGTCNAAAFGMMMVMGDTTAAKPSTLCVCGHSNLGAYQWTGVNMQTGIFTVRGAACKAGD